MSNFENEPKVANDELTHQEQRSHDTTSMLNPKIRTADLEAVGTDAFKATSIKT